MEYIAHGPIINFNNDRHFNSVLPHLVAFKCGNAISFEWQSRFLNFLLWHKTCKKLKHCVAFV